MTKSKKIGIGVISFITFILVVLGIYAVTADEPTESYYRKDNSPEFYGLTKAIIHQGDDFSLDDVRFRLFAKDFEDGDLTSKIEATSNVDTNKPGEYEINYKVTDSDGNKITLNVPITVVDTSENRYYERTLYTLPSVWNMSLAGTNRGNNDDRQILGFYMEANSKIYVNRVSGDKNLTLTYLNNDSQTEKGNFTITDEKQEITWGYNGVPFIKTVYETDIPVVVGIEVEEETGIHKLPYYYYQDDEESFFNEWNSLQDSYAVIDNQSTMTLLPYADRNMLVNHYSKCFHSLDEYLEYWDAVTKEYDEFLGLSYDPDDPIDQNVKTKYFFKANVHGAGSAYYAGDHVGINKASAASFFEQNWGGLHEVGHGYQGTLGSTGMALGEVSNNILGHYFQIHKYVDNYKYNDDWLGKIPNIEVKFNEKRLSGLSLNEIDVQDRLYVLINLLDTYDPKQTYAEINKIWRRAKRDGRTLTNQEAYVEAFAKLYNVNVIPYFESWGLPIRDDLKKDLVNLPILSSLGDMVSQEDANNVKNQLSKDGIYSLVTNEEMISTGLKGNMNITLAIDNIAELNGKKIIVTNNQNYKKEILINNSTVTLTDVPVGMYEIILPVPKNNIYDYSKYNYQTVVANTLTNYTFTYKNTSNNLNEFLAMDQYIELQGLGNSVFAKMTFDNQNINISFGGQPHSYFKNDLYASIKILDLSNTVKYEQQFLGATSYEKTNISLPYEFGYKIIIVHKEAESRLKIKSTYLIDEKTKINQEESNLSKSKTEDNVYIIGQYGLYQTTLDNSYNHYKDKINDYVEQLKNSMSENELKNKEIESQKKRVLSNSIQYLKEEDKKEFRDKYLEIYNGSAPKLNANEITFYQNETINLSAVFKGTDLEDGEFNLNDQNFQISKIPLDDNFKPEVGTHQITYSLKDSDDNTTNGTIVLTILKAEEEDNQDINTPSENNNTNNNNNSNNQTNSNNNTSSNNNHPSDNSNNSNSSNNTPNDNSSYVPNNNSNSSSSNVQTPNYNSQNETTSNDNLESETTSPLDKNEDKSINYDEFWNDNDKIVEDNEEIRPKKWGLLGAVSICTLILAIIIAKKQLKK